MKPVFLDTVGLLAVWDASDQSRYRDNRIATAPSLTTRVPL
jgi:hypothetical protein